MNLTSRVTNKMKIKAELNIAENQNGRKEQTSIHNITTCK